MGQDYLIATASTCDLTKEYLAEHNVPFIKYSYTFDEKVYYDDCCEVTRNDVYKKMRNGVILTTAAINAYAYKEFFEGLIKENGNKNIIFLDMSKVLSASHKFAEEAIEELKTSYPDIEIVYVDTCCVSGGLGMLVMNVIRNYEAGMGYKEQLQWIEDNKFKIAHRFTVDDLSYLKRESSEIPDITGVWAEITTMRSLSLRISGISPTIQECLRKSRASFTDIVLQALMSLQWVRTVLSATSR
jgi:DegV family protein with EDD domain